jgi:hypothetical protein
MLLTNKIDGRFNKFIIVINIATTINAVLLAVVPATMYDERQIKMGNFCLPTVEKGRYTESSICSL